MALQALRATVGDQNFFAALRAWATERAGGNGSVQDFLAVVTRVYRCSGEKRDLAATRRFFTQALRQGLRPTELTTDRAPAYPRVLDELPPTACHVAVSATTATPRNGTPRNGSSTSPPTARSASAPLCASTGTT
jgi:hypothetical protein